MFLNRTAARLRDEDEGSTMLAVIGLMAVTAVISVTVAAATIHGLGVSSSVQASIQSRAAAEAGIDVARAGLLTAGSCGSVSGVYESTTAPAYRARVQYDAGGGWVSGCPIDTATLVRIESVGTANAAGVAGASSGDTRTVEAIFNFVPDYVEVPQIDAAVYAHEIQGALKNFELISADNSLAADVQIRNGNVTCLNGATIAGDVILGNGFAALKDCAVTGSVHVSQYVHAENGSRVRGDVIAAGVGVAAGSDVARVGSGSIVDGNVYAGGTTSVLSSSVSRVKKNITVAGTGSSAARVASGSVVEGNVISSGSVSAAGTVQGTTSTNVGGLSAPPLPLIPNWTDVPYPSSTWANNGFTEITWTGSCSIGHGDPRWAALATRTTPTVVNALGCGPAGIHTLSTVDPLALKTKIAFIAQSFSFDKLRLESATAANQNVWFIVPDNTADGLPTCPSATAGDIYLHNEADIALTISAMAYTPCTVYSDRDGWRGQIYGGEVEFGQQAKLTFVPVGVPGVSFTGGLPPTLVLNGGHLANLRSIRELS
ncbi:hypothetical protein [Planctomonas psychrotolerans]|uniref:hypothetical protein n=1 Tax=Planctomonas psychrotolerans TaxID=2528712 RepID=UPI0012383F0A|nr:hypothetical protein [Planctomonas psychrotolerans]